MLCAGRDLGTAGILIIISVWCDLIGENCDENEKDQNDQSHQRLLVLFKTSPDFGSGFEKEPEEDGSWVLPGVVSRKKQFIPALMSAYQEL